MEVESNNNSNQINSNDNNSISKKITTNTLYQYSTQKNNWQYTKEKIEDFSNKKYNKGLELFSQAFEHSMKKAFHYATKPEQEKVIINYFITNIITKIKSQNFPSLLKLTVITIFKRFYLKKLIIDFDFYYVFYASFFLGFKLCEMDVGLNKICDIFPYLKETDKSSGKSNKEILLEYEFYILDVLGYDVHFYDPYKALRGLLFKVFSNENDFNGDNRNDGNNSFLGLSFDEYLVIEKDVFNFFSEIIDITFYTDFNFIFSYSEIALFSIVFINELINSSNNNNEDNGVSNNSSSTMFPHFYNSFKNLEKVVNDKLINRQLNLRQCIYKFTEDLITSSNSSNKCENYGNKNKNSSFSISSKAFERIKYMMNDTELIGYLKQPNSVYDKTQLEEIIKKATKFLNKFPQYREKLDRKRQEYISKLQSFSNNFERFINNENIVEVELNNNKDYDNKLDSKQFNKINDIELVERSSLNIKSNNIDVEANSHNNRFISNDKEYNSGGVNDIKQDELFRMNIDEENDGMNNDFDIKSSEAQFLHKKRYN